MTLCINRVGWTYPARNPITRSKYIKNPSCTRIPLGPVDPTGQTGRLLLDRLQRLTGQTARAYRSDRSVLSNANFGLQQYHPVSIDGLSYCQDIRTSERSALYFRMSERKFYCRLLADRPHHNISAQFTSEVFYFSQLLADCPPLTRR